jgi:hypothetical protein
MNEMTASSTPTEEENPMPRFNRSRPAILSSLLAEPLSLLRYTATIACVLAAPLAVAQETKSSASEPTRAEAQLRCITWRTHLTPMIDLQERFRVISPALALGLRSEIDRLELRCAVERPQAVFDRYTAIEQFLYDATQDQLPINPAKCGCGNPN